MKYSYYPEESEDAQINVITGQFIHDGMTSRERGRESERIDVELPRFRVEVQPHLELIRAPYFTSQPVRILDKPPVAPDVDFIPYKGVSNRILMNLNAGTGDYIFNPRNHWIDEEDLADSIKLAAIQQHADLVPRSKRGFVNYANDDPPQEFQIFRIAEKPTSYQDFSDNLLTTISTLDGIENLTAASFVDNILPNVK